MIQKLISEMRLRIRGRGTMTAVLGRRLTPDEVRPVTPASNVGSAILDGSDKKQEISSSKHIFDLLDKNFAMILME